MFRLTYLIFLFLTIVFGNKNFNINRMIVLLLHGGETYENEQFSPEYIEPTMNQAMVYAYYPTVNTPTGTYEIYLEYYSDFYKSNLELKIGEINHNKETVGKWIVKDAEFWNLYTKGRKDIPSFKIITKLAENRGNTNSTATFTNQWKFVIYFKTKDEKFEGNIEDPNLYDNLTEKFCKDYIYTEGGAKTIGAVCPIYLETNKPMEKCLNWRREDLVGKKCRKIVLKKTDDYKKKFPKKFIKNIHNILYPYAQNIYSYA